MPVNSKNDDLYDVLGVSKTATQDEIKKAFKKMALQHHPDKNKSNKDEAELKFKKITEAYGVLSDEQKRKRYDTTGSIDESEMSEMNVDINDILASMFGGMGGGLGGGLGGMGSSTFMFSGGSGGGFQTFTSMSSQSSQHTLAQPVHVEITLDEVNTGGHKYIELTIDDRCKQCEGTGAQSPNDVIKCLACQGRGNTTRRMGPFVTEMTCQSCSGKGMMIKNKRFCQVCNGRKTISKKKKIDIKIPKGAVHGSQQIMKEEGSFNVETNARNALLIIFKHVLPKNVTVDKGGNVSLNVKVPLESLLCGFKYEFTAYGQPIIFYSHKYFDPTKRTIIKDAGVSSTNNKASSPGHLVINFEVVFPDDTHVMQKYNDVFLRIFKKEEEKENLDKELKKMKEVKSHIVLNLNEK